MSSIEAYAEGVFAVLGAIVIIPVAAVIVLCCAYACKGLWKEITK